MPIKTVTLPNGNSYSRDLYEYQTLEIYDHPSISNTYQGKVTYMQDLGFLMKYVLVDISAEGQETLVQIFGYQHSGYHLLAQIEKKNDQWDGLARKWILSVTEEPDYLSFYNQGLEEGEYLSLLGC